MDGENLPRGVSRPCLRDGERRYFLSSAGPAVIGRQSCAILLSDPRVAPQHARISPSRQGFVLEALGGEVQVNGAVLSVPALLRPGDAVEIGPARLVYEGPEPVEAEAARAGFDQIFERARESVVAIRCGQAQGSGFFVKADGLLVTNRHVVGYEREVQVQTAEGHQEPGFVVRAFPEVDLAFVRIDGKGRPALPLAAAGSVRVGQAVLALGHPRGLSNTLTRGIVSAVDREIRGSLYLQTDASIGSGSSGGPLLNEYVEVVGVATLGLGEGQGLNFAVPAEAVRRRLERLRSEEARLQQGRGVYCVVCGLLSAGGAYCPGCGVELEKKGTAPTPPGPVSCARCSKVLSPGDQFCSGCGLQV